MAREINLVPDVKNEMIRALKLRNLIFFICIIVGIVSAVVLAVFGSVVGGQQIAISDKQKTLDLMSSKLTGYEKDLNDYLTIRDQLSDISETTSRKKVLSRTFDILATLLPTGADTITISELNVNLSDEPTFSFDAQANAGREPYIDYNVLDSFKKSMKYMRYDYGRYVDKDGNQIPAYCMIETADDGSMLNDNGQLYAYWTIEAEGCNPGEAEYIPAIETTKDEEDEAEQNSDTEDELTDGLQNSVGGNTRLNTNSNNNKNDEEETDEDEDSTSSSSSSSSKTKRVSPDAYKTEEYNGLNVIKIWRTPQFDEWYTDDHMTTDGTIQGIPHFESNCIKYTGEPTDKTGVFKWTDSNEDCKLVSTSEENEDGIRISDSSNGRGAGDELVLRFSAIITLNPEVYSFNNFHMIALPPSGRHNVTDSYVQIQAMFGEAARPCAEGDTACSTNTTNLKGGN